MKLTSHLVGALLLALSHLACAASAPLDRTNTIYQFGLEIPKPENDPLIWNKTTAFLWVPPQCQRVRGVIIAAVNVIERRFCDDPIVRDEATRDNLAIVLFAPGWKGEIFQTDSFLPFVQTVLDRLAEKSGYYELRSVPWIPFGHSGNSQFCEAMAKNGPARTLANIVVKGKIPGVTKDGSKAALIGIPTLFVTGEFEEVMPPGKVRNAWWTRQMELFHEGRKAVPDSLMTGLEDRSRGHLSWLADTSQYTALFIREAVKARLGDDDSLRQVAFDSGWLADEGSPEKAAPATQYKGDKVAAFWFFNEAQWRAWQPLQRRDDGKKEQLLAFEQDGEIAPWWPGWGVQELKFAPLEDGVSFRVKARFRDEVPQPFADAGTKLGHAAGGEIEYSIAGWAGNIEQTGADTFRVRFDREGVNGRTVHVLLAARHPGDAAYRETTAAAHFYIPYENKEGTKQTLTFPPIADVKAGTASLPLKASTDSGLPVDYYVSWGPAKIEGDTLRFTDIPAKARFPIEVKVTAYQWGKATEPRCSTANSVTRTFFITP